MSETQPKRFHAVRLSIDNLLGGVSKFGRSFKDVRATFFWIKNIRDKPAKTFFNWNYCDHCQRHNGPKGCLLSPKELFLSHVASWSKFSFRISRKLQLQNLDQLFLSINISNTNIKKF